MKLTALWAGMTHELASLVRREPQRDGYFPAWDPSLPEGSVSYGPRRSWLRMWVPAFFVLAYLLSWVYWPVVLGIMGRRTLFWFVPWAFGPPLAALLVTGLVDGRHGIGAFLRRWVLWRVEPRWYVLALVGLPALGLVVGLPFRDGTERFAGSGPALVVTYLATWSFLAVLGGGQEEPGWRGFALPRMQERMGPLTASVVLGVLWGLWHLPVELPDLHGEVSAWLHGQSNGPTTA